MVLSLKKGEGVWSDERRMDTKGWGLELKRRHVSGAEVLAVTGGGTYSVRSCPMLLAALSFFLFLLCTRIFVSATVSHCLTGLEVKLHSQVTDCLICRGSQCLPVSKHNVTAQ